MWQAYDESHTYKDHLMSVCLDLPPARGNFDAIPAKSWPVLILGVIMMRFSQKLIHNYGFSALTYCKMPQKLWEILQASSHSHDVFTLMSLYGSVYMSCSSKNQAYWNSTTLTERWGRHNGYPEVAANAAVSFSHSSGADCRGLMISLIKSQQQI